MITLSIFVIITLASIIVGMRNDAGTGWVTLLTLLLFWLIGNTIYSCNFDDEAIAERKAKEEQKAAQRRANETPHVIREADGCKVYTFLSGDRYHYFTRCPDGKTVTDSSWDECHSEMVGKVSTRKCVTKYESIEVSK